MEYTGAGGKLIHEKNQKQKISWHCPFKHIQIRAQVSALSRVLRFNYIAEVNLRTLKTIEIFKESCGFVLFMYLYLHIRRKPQDLFLITIENL